MLTSGGLLVLGALILWALDSGVAALPNPGRSLAKRQTIVLDENSSCNDLGTYQSQIGVSHITAEMYNMVDAHGKLDDYFFDHEGGEFTDYVNGFAAPYGVGQTYHCGLPTPCDRIDCAQLQDPSAPGTGAAYAVLLSFSNFNLYLNELFTALNMAKEDWNGLQVVLQQSYWPPPKPDIFLKEFVGGLQTLTSVIAVSAGLLGPVAAVAIGVPAALSGGILGGFNLAASTSDLSLSYLASLEANTEIWYNTLYDELAWANGNLTQTGQYLGNGQASGLADIIANGAWVDNTDHPALNDDSSGGKAIVTTDALKQALRTYLLGNMINYAWRQQGTFIVKYDMTEEDYNAQGDDWHAGNGDFRFRMYYGGAAFFLQSYIDDNDQLHAEPRSAYPPGWGSVVDDLGGCDTTCIMRSAADGFHDNGFNFNFSTMSTELSSDQTTALGWLGNLPSARGFFNIPICDLTGSGEVTSIDALKFLLEDQNFSYDGDAQKALWCYCKDLKDMNGSRFADNMTPELNTLWDDSYNCELGWDGVD